MDLKGKLAEDQLGIRLNSGDERAYDQLFKQLYKPLCYFAFKIVLNFDIAEDIVQDNLLKLWQRHQDFESTEKIKSFLYVSVRNSCYDELKHQKVMNKHQDHLGHSEPTDQSILDTMMHAEVVHKVFLAVDTLPEQCRKIIKMTFEDGKSPKEIAEQLGITTSTVSNQKMRGLILLKKRLSDRDVAIAMAILIADVHHFIK